MPTHIDPTTHEHGGSAKVYTYEGDYEVADHGIQWQAHVSTDELQREFRGEIPMTSPALPALAEQAVRDAIVKRIDTFDDKQAG